MCIIFLLDMKRELRKLAKYCEKAKKLLQDQEDPSPIAGWAREIMAYGRDVIAREDLDEETLADSYTVLYGIADNLYEHPRLLLQLKQLAYDMVVRGEAMTGETYKVKDKIHEEIEKLQANIQAADERRWDDIHDGHVLKSDPVEWTEAYEAVIDEVDREAYENLKDSPRGMGFCFGYWAEKRNALERRGIEWDSPSVLNPRVMFD